MLFVGDWDSSLLPSVNKSKRRISLFSREEQERINASRRMKGLPDLSAVMAMELGLTPTEPPSSSNPLVASDVNPASLGHHDSSSVAAVVAPKKKSKKRSRDAPSVGDGLEALPEEGDDPEVAEPSSSKKKERKQLPSEGDIESREVEAARPSVLLPLVDEGSPNLALADDPQNISPEAPLQRKKSKRSDGQGMIGRQAPSVASPSREASVPGSSSGGVPAVRKTPRVDFPDRVLFDYDGPTPLIYSPQRCTELVSQIKCGPKPFPPVADLIFKDEYIDSACTKLLVSISSDSFIFFSALSVFLSPYSNVLVLCLVERWSLELCHREI